MSAGGFLLAGDGVVSYHSSARALLSAAQPITVPRGEHRRRRRRTRSSDARRTRVNKRKESRQIWTYDKIREIIR
jgi:hypothetical protein